MTRAVQVLTLLVATGCAGRWLAVEQPIRPSPTRPPRDYRVVLKNDSVLTLHDAVLRNDSLVEVGGEQPSRGVEMLDVAQVEVWQSGGERAAGFTTLGLVAAVIAFVVAVGLSIRD